MAIVCVAALSLVVNPPTPTVTTNNPDLPELKHPSSPFLSSSIMTSNVTPSAQQEYDQLFADKSKSSKHPEDLNNLSDDEHHPSDDEDPEHFFEKDEDLDDLDQTELRMRSRYFLPRMRQEANTGPKGVIADAQSFEQAKKSQRFSFFRSNKDLPQVEDLSVNGNNDEEGFMERWRRNRLAELQEPNSRQRSSSRGTSPGKRVFGNLLTVDAEGYLDAVDYTGDNVNVIVLIYDDNVSFDAPFRLCTYLTVSSPK